MRVLFDGLKAQLFMVATFDSAALTVHSGHHVATADFLLSCRTSHDYSVTMLQLWSFLQQSGGGDFQCQGADIIVTTLLDTLTS